MARRRNCHTSGRVGSGANFSGSRSGYLAMENTYLHARPPARVARRPDVPRGAPQRSDAELLTASIRDPDAFTELFRRHWDDLYRFCLHRAGAAGEDIAAEAFRVA